MMVKTIVATQWTFHFQTTCQTRGPSSARLSCKRFSKTWRSWPPPFERPACGKHCVHVPCTQSCPTVSASCACCSIRGGGVSCARDRKQKARPQRRVRPQRVLRIALPRDGHDYGYDYAYNLRLCLWLWFGIVLPSF